MAVRAIEHAADAVEVAAVLIAMQVIVAVPAYIVAAARRERSPAQHGAAVLADTHLARSVGVFAPSRLRNQQPQEIALGDHANDFATSRHWFATNLLLSLLVRL
jgi:hypothetical protein